MSKLLSINEVAKRVGVSVNAIRIRIGKGKFPAPTERKGKEMFWDESTLGVLPGGFSGTAAFDLHPTPLDLYGSEEGYVKLLEHNDAALHTEVYRSLPDDGALLAASLDFRISSIKSVTEQAIGRTRREGKSVDIYVYGDPDGPVAIERSYRQFMRSYIHHPDYINRQQGLQVDAPDLSDPEVFRDVLQKRTNALHKAQDDAQRYGLPTYGLYHPSNVLTLGRMAELPDDFGKSVLAPIVTKSIVNQMEAGVKACSGGCVDCKNKPTE